MSQYYEFTIDFEPFEEQVDILVAYLGELGFESFIEEDHVLKAYLPEFFINEKIFAEIEKLKPEGSEHWSVSCQMLPEVNWNEEWEKNYPPVEIGKLCRIRAAFHHTVEGYEMELLIDPKMAFGTGHHATTSLMVEELFSLKPIHGNVADVGCGTSVLAIVAEKLGADRVDAVDIEAPSVENSLLNIQLNHCSKINVSLGSVEHLPLKEYNMIIANINRNVLLSHLEAYSKLLLASGKLLLSGFFVHDISSLTAKAADFNLLLCGSREKENWSCLTFEKSVHA